MKPISDECFPNIEYFTLFSLWQDGASALFKAAHKGFSAVVAELLKYKPNLYLLPVSERRNVIDMLNDSDETDFNLFYQLI